MSKGDLDSWSDMKRKRVPETREKDRRKWVSERNLGISLCFALSLTPRFLSLLLFFFFFLGFGFCFLGFLLGFGYGEEEARVWNVKENSGSIESIYITEPHFKLFGLFFELISPSTTFTLEWNWNCLLFFFFFWQSTYGLITTFTILTKILEN